MRRSTATILAAALTAPALAVEVPFDVPWIGYDTAVYPQGIFPLSSQSADFDGDGAPDLATVSLGGTAWMSILRGDGAGGYLPPQMYDLAIESMDLAAADFDGDGDVDIVTADTGRFWEGISVSLHRNDGAGLFAPAGIFLIGQSGPSGIVAADLDGDGWIDVATANDAYIVCNNTVSVLMNNDGNGFLPAQVYAISSCTNEIDAGDLNGDGHVDLVVAHESNRFTIMMNDQEGGFTTGPVIGGVDAGSIPDEPTVHVADVDLDGHLDVLFSNQDTGYPSGTIGLWRNDGEGGLGPAETLPFNWHGGGAIDVATADVTGDGWPDVLCATGAYGNWFLLPGDAKGGFLPARKLRAGHVPSAIDTPDLDGDGDLDVMVLGAQSLEACVYLNPGDGAFVQPAAMDFADPAIAPAFATNIESGDLDGDGDLDLVVGFRSDFESSFGTTVRRNNGDGTFGPRETYAEPTYARWNRLHDIDGDGDLDLVWVNSNGQFRRRFNNGAGTFGPALSAPTVGEAAYFAFADVDNDGDDDIVVPGFFEVGVMRNNGAGVFVAPLYTEVESFLNILALGDFDADGNVDVLTDSGAQGYPQISFGHGNGLFGPTFTVPTGRSVISMAAADLDLDGSLDFTAVYNLDEKGITVRRGHGDGGFFLQVHEHGSFQWDDYTVGGRTDLVDVDGDGFLDALFANVQAQDFSYWRNNGDGTFAPVVRLGAGHNVQDLVAGDFTGDGVVDVAMSARIDDGPWWHTGVVLIRGKAARVPGDVDGDGAVGFPDLIALLGAWGPCAPPCPADLDGDGAVGLPDLLIVLSNWS